MEDASESFEAFKDVSEIERLDPEFSAVSDWIALNRSTLSVDELSQKTSNLTAFDSATEIKLWDNFFYQVVTQKSFYVKEQLGQFLVLQNLLKEKEENETLKILANAKITLPIVLFNENETKNVTKSTSKVSSDKPVFDSHSLLKIMLLKDFKQYFIITFIIIIILYFILSIFVIGYEERTNKTNTAFVFYETMKTILFSVDFWAEKMKLSGVVAVLMAFMTTSFIISFPLNIIINLYKNSSTV